MKIPNGGMLPEFLTRLFFRKFYSSSIQSIRILLKFVNLFGVSKLLFSYFSEVKDEVHHNEVKHERKKWEAPSASTNIGNKLPDDLERYC